MPQFSIVIPCYNAAATLSETLVSIQAQTCTDWEVICVDDGSTDLTRELIADAGRRDKRIKLAFNVGKGPSRARNLGARQLAAGPIIAFCDADDIWAAGKLADLVIAFEDQTVDGAYGQIAFFQDDPKQARVFSTVPTRRLGVETLLGENPVCTMSNFAVRKSCFVQSDGFDPSLVHNEDLEWLVRLAACGANIIGRQMLHVWYRSSSNGLSADLMAMQAGREQALATAATFGVTPSAKSHAVHLRYLARRALRLGLGRTMALRFSVAGMRHSPSGFLSPARRGGLTLIGAVCAVFLPRRLSCALFSR